MPYFKKKKFSTQIGGKGTVRRKPKKKKITKTISIDEKKFKTKVESINKKILQLDVFNYNKLRDFINELIIDYIKDIKRDDINKKNGLRYKDLNDMGPAFIYKNFFYAVDEIKMLIKSDTYEFVKSNFKDNGRKLFINFIESIDKIMVNKEYKVDLDDEKYNSELFNKALNFFKISSENKVHFKDIREQYEIQINKDGIKQEEKDEINKYYVLLRNQYKEYLKSF